MFAGVFLLVALHTHAHTHTHTHTQSAIPTVGSLEVGYLQTNRNVWGLLLEVNSIYGSITAMCMLELCSKCRFLFQLLEGRST
jgi:hypothetical protein